MTYGAFLSFLTYSFQIFEPFKMLAQIFTDLKSAQASAERVFRDNIHIVFVFVQFLVATNLLYQPTKIEIYHLR